MKFNRIFLCLLLSMTAISSVARAQDDYVLVWLKEMISTRSLHEIGRSWFEVDALRFDGTSQWTSSCPWDGENGIPKPPSQWGYNIGAQSHLEIGDRAIAPKSVKFRHNPGRGLQVETLNYSHALLNANEVGPTFPTNKGRITVSIKGHVDRCPNGFGPAMTSAPNLDRRYIKFKLRCNDLDEYLPGSTASSNAPGIWTKRMEIWYDAAKAVWPTNENKYIETSTNIDFDTTSCNSEMFLTASVTQEERLTIDSMEVWLWSL